MGGLYAIFHNTNHLVLNQLWDIEGDVKSNYIANESL